MQAQLKLQLRLPSESALSVPPCQTDYFSQCPVPTNAFPERGAVGKSLIYPQIIKTSANKILAKFALAQRSNTRRGDLWVREFPNFII